MSEQRSSEPDAVRRGGPREGHGQSWTSEPEGCLVKLRGILPDEERRAEDYAIAICDEVLLVVPQASVIREWREPKAGARQLWIRIHVSHHELAVFQGGPMHRKAIGKARGAANGHRSWWTFDGEETFDGF